MLVTWGAAGGERRGSGDSSGRIGRRWSSSSRRRSGGGANVARVAFLGLATTAAVVTATSFGGAEVEVERWIIGGGGRHVGLVLAVIIHCVSAGAREGVWVCDRGDENKGEGIGLGWVGLVAEAREIGCTFARWFWRGKMIIIIKRGARSVVCFGSIYCSLLGLGGWKHVTSCPFLFFKFSYHVARPPPPSFDCWVFELNFPLFQSGQLIYSGWVI